MSIGELIKIERIRNHLSQEEVAKAIGSTKQAIYKYENGIVTNIPMDKIEIMANIFGVTPAYLMGWSKEQTSPTEPKLTEGEEMLLELFRRIPEDKQTFVLHMIRAALENQQ